MVGWNAVGARPEGRSYNIKIMESVRLKLDADGVAWVIFNDPRAKVNILNRETVGQLDKILDELLQKKPRGVVFISEKPDIFIAGADIREVEAIRDAKIGAELSRAGHKIFAKIEQLGAPSVAAIDGACVGGGYELALACTFRVAADTPKTQIGLPETQLGIIPGWGGTQRLPRLVGLPAALDIIVAGKVVNATRAAKIGMVDAAVPRVALRETAKKFALKNRGRNVAPTKKWWLPDFVVRSVARKQTLKKTRGHYPAPLKAIEVAGRGFDAEAQAFGEMAVTSPCKNLIRVFFLREKYAKLRVEGAESAKKIEKIGVIGAGVMGAGIAQWCSARGLTVRLKDIKPEFVAAGMKRIGDVYREGVKRRRISELDAQHGIARVHPTTDYTGFSDCDLVIEAVLEKIEVKQQVFRELVPKLKSDCIIASNTSAIPIDDLAAATGKPDRFVGIHFFNPVHKMPLVEVVRGTKTAPEVLASAVEFVKKLKKIPVVVRGSPGFLVNRLLLPYLNEAGLMLEEGASVREIDDAMLEFGMPMGPLRLIDEVGIDVAFDVAEELAEAFRGRMNVAPILQKLHEAGLKGRKGGAGFYVYDGKKERENAQIRQLFAAKSAKFSATDIQNRLVGVMISEAKLCLEEKVVETEDDIDAGMIFGTGFPPFRGGLVKHARDSGLWT
jgi:3-hydroxyacyl-CoA dehydrogenase/enoyl-CoA hydratase/3-hydroxybutyryl-CoA epimerase